MTIFQAIILGLVQGLTEFLPVSSSGHLVLFPALFGWELQDVAFDAVIHLSTLLVMLIYFRKDILEVMRSHHRVMWMILLAIIPVGLVGLWIESLGGALRSFPVVFISLAVWGVVLMVADRFASRNSHISYPISQLSWPKVLLVGVVQAIALIPGTSRSGIAITAGLFAGLDRKLATRLAFLVGIPAIALAGFSKTFDMVSGSVELDLLPLAFGFIAAFVSGYVAVSLLLKLLERTGFFWFGLYRILLATFLFLVWLQTFTGR